ncbi:MAG TPA: hypothetical protein PKD91_07355, partial [Bacteroidia bacterium]|nr:hypothetical protein [Bacteroidia bacterium]
LLKYKELVGSNGNGDLVITLSKTLKAEKEKNALLEQEIRELKSGGSTTKSTPEKGANKTESTPHNPSSEPKKDPNVFSLPK